MTAIRYFRKDEALRTCAGNLMGCVNLMGCILAAALWGGCALLPRSDFTLTDRDAFSLALPNRIDIVEPFTRIKSLSGGGVPDGIDLVVQAIGALDNPGLVLVGTLRVELFEFVASSADRKGSRLEQWQVELRTDHQQRIYWNHLTQMYEFHLGANLANLPQADSYVLLVTYTSPLGKRLSDELVITRRSGTRRR